MDPMTLTWLQFVPIAALVSATVTLLIRYADRPRPVILLETQLEEARAQYSGELSGEFVVGAVAITNSGDGDAYEFELFGHLCDVAIASGKLAPNLAPRWTQQLPALKAGETVTAKVLFPTAVRDGDHEAKVIIRWTPWPGRPWTAATRRIRQVSLAELDSAMPYPVGVIEPTALPRWFRRWRQLAPHTERGRQRLARFQRAEEAAEAERTPEQ